MSKTKNKLYFTSFLVAILVLMAFTPRQPNVLIIGDSISIGYTPFVEKQFSRQATVVHNQGNAQHTGTGLEKVDEWLGAEQWDIVQFNWGLWDLCYRHPDSKVYGNRDKINGKITHTVDEYAANLDSIISLLQKKTNAKLIFVTTTYVPENEAGRYTADVIRYNDAAKTVLKKYEIPVNDIYQQSISIHKKFGKGSDDVHYTTEGYQALGKLINDFLDAEIKQFKN